MARTLSGACTGEAARIEKAERNEAMRNGAHQLIQSNQFEFADLLDEIKLLNPAGWEVWFDSCADIPDQIDWLRVEAVLATLRLQIQELGGQDADRMQDHHDVVMCARFGEGL